MNNRANLLVGRAASKMKIAIEAGRARTLSGHEALTPDSAEAEGSDLMRCIASGRALSLAEYVHADEILARSALTGTVQP